MSVSKPTHNANTIPFYTSILYVSALVGYTLGPSTCLALGKGPHILQDSHIMKVRSNKKWYVFQFYSSQSSVIQVIFILPILYPSSLPIVFPMDFQFHIRSKDHSCEETALPTPTTAYGQICVTDMCAMYVCVRVYVHIYLIYHLSIHPFISGGSASLNSDTNRL